MTAARPAVQDVSPKPGAVTSGPRWSNQLTPRFAATPTGEQNWERLEPRLGKNKAIVAIARKLLVAVWHILSKGCADRFADPERVARKLLNHAYRLGRARRPQGQTAVQYVRQQLDRLGLGAELTAIPLGKHDASSCRRPNSVPMPTKRQVAWGTPFSVCRPAALGRDFRRCPGCSLNPIRDFPESHPIL